MKITEFQTSVMSKFIETKEVPPMHMKVVHFSSSVCIGLFGFDVGTVVSSYLDPVRIYHKIQNDRARLTYIGDAAIIQAKVYPDRSQSLTCYLKSGRIHFPYRLGRTDKHDEPDIESVNEAIDLNEDVEFYSQHFELAYDIGKNRMENVSEASHNLSILATDLLVMGDIREGLSEIASCITSLLHEWQSFDVSNPLISIRLFCWHGHRDSPFSTDRPQLLQSNTLKRKKPDHDD